MISQDFDTFLIIVLLLCLLAPICVFLYLHRRTVDVYVSWYNATYVRQIYEEKEKAEKYRISGRHAVFDLVGFALKMVFLGLTAPKPPALERAINIYRIWLVVFFAAIILCALHGIFLHMIVAEK